MLLEQLELAPLAILALQYMSQIQCDMPESSMVARTSKSLDQVPNLDLAFQCWYKLILISLFFLHFQTLSQLCKLLYNSSNKLLVVLFNYIQYVTIFILSASFVVSVSIVNQHFLYYSQMTNQQSSRLHYAVPIGISSQVQIHRTLAKLYLIIYSTTTEFTF